MNDLKAVAADALREEGEALMGVMRQEVRMTTDGNTPGRTAWRDHIAKNIEHISTTITATGIEMEFGYSPDNEADTTRAMVVAYGSGDKADGGGTPIHAGPAGRQVWNGDLSGKKSSEAQTEYDLPEAFNQQGNQFIQNAIKRTRARFGGQVENTFRTLPGAVFCKRV